MFDQDGQKKERSLAGEREVERVSFYGCLEEISRTEEDLILLSFLI